MEAKEPNIYEDKQEKKEEVEPYKSEEVVIVNKGRGKGGVEFRRGEKKATQEIEEEKKKLEGIYRQDNKDKWEIVGGKFKKVA
ncbi:MAG: hypothetical protein AAB877_00150 [Patescibacteria group bacterium]